MELIKAYLEDDRKLSPMRRQMKALDERYRQLENERLVTFKIINERQDDSMTKFIRCILIPLCSMAVIASIASYFGSR